MSYWWDAELAAGAEATEDDLTGAGLGNRFEDQQAAEEWLGAFYDDLADLGVARVSLFEEDRLVSGPMPLGE